MRLQCVHCGKQYSLSDENAGTHFRCRSCHGLSPVRRSAKGTPVAEVLFSPGGTALPEAELASDLFTDTLPPTSGYTLPTVPAARPSQRGATSRVPSDGSQNKAADGVSVDDTCYRLAAQEWEATALPAAAPALRPSHSSGGSRTGSGTSTTKANRRSANEEWLLLKKIGGVAAMIVGVAVVVCGIYVIFHPEGDRVRRPLRALLGGCALIGIGFRLASGQPIGHD